ncbi:SRB8 [Sanghuangporus vaninii]
MADNGQNDDREKPPIYECSPPTWLPKTSNSADLGFINFFPPRPSEDGDVLNESTIKNGFKLNQPIQAETYTAKTRQIKELKEGFLIKELEDFMNQIFQRRAENLAQIPSSTFRIPSRATLNDAKRSAWFSDLANPDVPLYKLSKSIPHGVRGNDLLDLLHANNVAIPRAVWFVRVFGSNETAGLRNKPNYNPLQYSIEWANVMTGYLKKQLSEIALPSAPRLGLNIKQTFKGVLGDPDSRERWVSKFVYSLDLLRIFYLEYMVDRTTFLSWLVQTIGNCNLAQADFMARLADDYFSELGSCRAIVKPFIDACLAKLQEISNSPSKDTLYHLQVRLENLLRRAFLAAPTCFVSPTAWKSHSETIESILAGNESVWRPSSESQARQNVRLLVDEVLLDVKRRNEALLFRTGAQPAKGYLRSMVSDVKLLNSITSRTELNSLAFFGTSGDSQPEIFSRKLFLLLSWGVCWLQYGDHRPYAAATLLRQWRDRAEERACRRDIESPDDFIQDGLFDWLDTDPKLCDDRNLTMTTLLFGELIQKGLFSYDRYIQRLIARGEMGLSFNEEPASRHRKLLRVIPLYSPAPALVSQRKLALYGVRTRTIPEDQVEKGLKDEIRDLLPEVFKGESASMPQSPLPSDSLLRSAARYEQIRVVKQWFMPSVRKFLSKSFLEIPGNSTAALRVYCVIIECLDAMRCYRTCLEFTLDVLKMTITSDLLLAIVDYLKRGLILWACMDAMADIASALLDAHQAWKAKGVHIRCLVILLLEVDDSKYLDAISRQHVIEDAGHFAQALRPVDEAIDIEPTVIPEVFALLQEANSDAPPGLANALWYKYRASTNWTYVVWTNVAETLRQIPAIITDASERRFSALRYAKFLLHVDLHSSEGIDRDILQWLSGPGMTELKSMNAEVWDVMIVVFAHLAIHDAIRIATLLQGIVYPAWQIAASIENVSQFEKNSPLLQAANALCSLLLVEQRSASEEGFPPSDLMEMQRLRTRRRDVFTDADFRLLVENIPALVFIEHNEDIQESFRDQVTDLRRSLCCKADFRLSASSNVSTVVGAFANPSYTKGSQESMHEPLISALRLIFNDEERDDHTHFTSLLSPWKLSATAAVTSFVLQQIGQRLHNPSTEMQAKAELTKLAGRLMQNATSAQEADFVSEMVKGVSGDVAVAFMNEGLQRIVKILNDINDEKEALKTIPSKTGHFLNLLSTIMRPFRNDSTALPTLEQPIQDSFVSCLSVKFQSLENIAQGCGANYHDLIPLTDTTLFLARLLQFDLGFPGSWTQTMKDTAHRFLSNMLRLAIYFGGSLSNPVAFSLLLDTAFYIFDELPFSPRQTTDLFQGCISLDSLDIPVNLSPEYRELIRTLERHAPHCPDVADLVYSSRDGDGNLQPGASVQMRPWEWIESLGDPPLLDAKDVQKEAEEKERRGLRYLVRNNTSIPLELFATHALGEGARRLGLGSAESSSGKDEQLRGLFEDDLAAESIYEREWKDSRVGFTCPGESTEDSKSRADGDVEPSRRGTPTSRRTSPALSVHTSHGGASSAAGPPSATSSSRRTQSPSLAGREVIDVDALFSGGSAKGKRKASSAGLEEGEVIVIQDNSAKKKARVSMRKKK